MRTMIAAMAMSVAATVIAQQTNTLDTFRQSYEQQQQSILAQYGKALDTIMADLKKKGDLDNILILQTEKKRFDAEKTIPTPKDAKDSFRPATEAYYQTMVTLLGRYVKALDGLIKKEVAADRIEEASLIKKEKDKADFMLADIQTCSVTASTNAIESAITPAQRLPMQFKGKFYVSVDDAAIFYVKGRQVYQAPIRESVSSETTVKQGDCITVNLINTGGPCYFTMAFLTTDKKYVINFRQEDCRLLWDRKKLNLTQKDFDQLKQQPTKELGKSPASFPFSTTSDWIWGQGDNCWVTAILTKDMITKQE